MRTDYGLESIFRQNLRQFGLKPGDHILIALSGGVDSMCLLKLSMEAGLNVSAFHFNYGLRGDESDKDQWMVQAECKKLNVPILLKKASVNAFSSTSGLQSKARELRYKAIEEIFRNGFFKAVFTAHHSDDIAETVLMNLARGAGISGLKGLPVSRSYIIRPLFNISKSAILNYAELKALVWREDASNLTNKYTRNIFRNTLLPELEKSVPGLKRGLSKSALQVSSEWENFIFLAESFKQSFVFPGLHFDILDPGSLSQAPHPEALGLRLFPEWNLSETQWKDILKALKEHRSGAFFKTKSHEILVYKSRLFFHQHATSSPIQTFNSPLPLSFSLGHFSFFQNDQPDLPCFSLPAERHIEVRLPSEGQRFLDAGNKTKSTLQILHKHQVHPWLRREWPVFCSSNQTVLALPGFLEYENSALYQPGEPLVKYQWIFL